MRLEDMNFSNFFIGSDDLLNYVDNNTMYLPSNVGTARQVNPAQRGSVKYCNNIEATRKKIDSRAIGFIKKLNSFETIRGIHVYRFTYNKGFDKPIPFITGRQLHDCLFKYIQEGSYFFMVSVSSDELYIRELSLITTDGSSRIVSLKIKNNETDPLDKILINARAKTFKQNMISNLINCLKENYYLHDLDECLDIFVNKYKEKETQNDDNQPVEQDN